MNDLINNLIDYGLKKDFITENDVDYIANRLIDLLDQKTFNRVKGLKEKNISDILKAILNIAVERGLVENNTTARDLFDTRVMDILIPRPSQVINKFNSLYAQDPRVATDYFYQLAVSSNYIRMDRVQKNIKYSRYNKYGKIIITINLSKPEKDPAEIARAKLIRKTDYPRCLLCKENEGFAGNYQRDARQTIRLIPIKLGSKQYYFQYSPYVYYNEHCIILNKEHIPMVIDRDIFHNLLEFCDLFPHYFIGSNADLPIVGGSILSHDHYQGGAFDFPIWDAQTIQTYKIKDSRLKAEILNWPLSTIRLQGTKEEIEAVATIVLAKWRKYSDEALAIIADDGQVHNTITPIVRKKDGLFQMLLVLRNNRQTKDYPLGIFHPHQDKHHIKKENIGLIEVMGLAILPARLKAELELIKQVLQGDTRVYPELEKHRAWIERLSQISTADLDELLADEVARIFVAVLEDAGVYKMNEPGIKGFKRFIKSLGWEELG